LKEVDYKNILQSRFMIVTRATLTTTRYSRRIYVSIVFTKKKKRKNENILP